MSAMVYKQFLLYVVISYFIAMLSCAPQYDRINFEPEDRRLQNIRKQRPCKTKSAEGRFFFDLSYVNVNNNYNYNCGESSSGQRPNAAKPGAHFGGGNHGGILGSHNQNGGLLGQHLQGVGGLFGSHNGGNINAISDEVIEQYNRPNPGANIVATAQGIQGIVKPISDTVLGVTNSVTGTIQDIGQPLISSLGNRVPNRIQVQPNYNNNNNGGFFFGLFDGSLISSFFSGASTTEKPPSSATYETHETYDELEPDPYDKFKPGQYIVGNNPLTGQYTISLSSLKPKKIIKKINHGIDEFVDPLLEFFI